MQLPLFAEEASLCRVRPELNEWQYYRLEVWPDLFGRALLVRQWGRIGIESHRRMDPYADQEAALNALGQIVRAKRRKGIPAPPVTAEDHRRAQPSAGVAPGSAVRSMSA